MNLLTLEESFEMNLLQLIKNLRDIESIKKFFNDKNYKIVSNIPGVVGINYKEGYNNMRPKWAPEARGRFYWIGGDQVIELKNAMLRGSEIIQTRTNAYAQTQNIDENKKKLLNLMLDDNPINAHLTAKIDGALIVVNVYPKECEQYSIIQTLSQTHATQLNKKLVTFCVESDMPIITASTHGTLFMSHDFEDHFLKSLNSISERPTEKKQEWNEKQFANLINAYYKELNLNNNEMVNLCFESFCKNRTDLSGRINQGLAVSYDQDGFVLLGMVNKNKYVPHFLLPRKIFKQPLFIQVKNTKQILEISDKLNKTVLGCLSSAQFKECFDTDNFTSECIHPEGFVLLTKFKDDDEYFYSKLKTNIYYKCHKIYRSNLDEILEYPESCQEYYPIIKKLKSFYINKNEKIKSIVQDYYDIIRHNLEGNFFERYSFNGLTSSQIKFYEKRLMEVESIIGITNNIYQIKNDKLFPIVRLLLIEVKPWKEDWETRLMYLINGRSNLIDQIQYAVIGVKI